MAATSGKKHKNIDKAKDAPPTKRRKIDQTSRMKATTRKPLANKSAKKSVMSKKKMVKTNKTISKPINISSTKLKNVMKGHSSKSIKIHAKTPKSTKTTPLSKKTSKASSTQKMSLKKVDGKNNNNAAAILKLKTKLNISKVKSASEKNKLMKAKLDKTKALKAKAKSAAAKAQKLKVAKSLSKLENKKALQQAKVANKTKPTPKKHMIAPSKSKKAVIDTENGKLSKDSNAENKSMAKPATKESSKSLGDTVKRKNIAETDDIPRKRRSVLPSKKYADFEIDVPSKRTIKASQKYTEFDINTTQKSVSELRAFIQDKKKPPLKSDKKNKITLTPAVSSSNKPTLGSKIKVFKPSEMRPAEKLLKKLQKKLENEAKAVSSPQSLEKREKAKIKITKVVTYNKSTVSSEDLDEKPEEKVASKTSKVKQQRVIKSKVDMKRKTTSKPNLVKKSVVKQVKTAQKVSRVPKEILKPKKIKEMKREERPIQAHFIAKYNVKQPDDTSASMCWITGISVFPSGEIIVVDMANRKIKLFSKEFGFLSQIILDTIPQDISTSPVNASHAYFSKPFVKEGIQKICMSDGKMKLSDSFLTNGANRGIVCTKTGIFTSVQDGRYHDLDINHFKIDLLDYEGNLIQSVSTDLTGSRLFKLPLYFTVDNTGKQIIVSDCIKNHSYVISVDLSGKVKFKYEGIDNNLITPRGLATDDENNIYVTDWEKNDVYILSPDGKRLQVLFTQMELLQQGTGCEIVKPYQLCIYKQDDKKALLLSEKGSNTIKLFHLSKKSENSVNVVPQSVAITEDKTGVSAVEVKQDVCMDSPQAKADIIPAVKQQNSTTKKGKSPTKVLKIKETANKAKVIKLNRRQALKRSEVTTVENKTELSNGDEIDQTKTDLAMECSIIHQTQIKTDDLTVDGPPELEAYIQVSAQNVLVQDATIHDVNELKENTTVVELHEVQEDVIIAKENEIQEDATVGELNKVQEDAIIAEINEMPDVTEAEVKEVQEDAIIAENNEIQEAELNEVQEAAIITEVNNIQEDGTVAEVDQVQEEATLIEVNKTGIVSETLSVSQIADEVQANVNLSCDMSISAQTNELEFEKQAEQFVEIPDFNQSATVVLPSDSESDSVTLYMQEVDNPLIEFEETVKQVEAMETNIYPAEIPTQNAAVVDDVDDHQQSVVQIDDVTTEIIETEATSEVLVDN